MHNKDLTKELEFAQKLVRNGGPNDKKEQEIFLGWIKEHAIGIQKKMYSKEIIAKFQEIFEPLHREDTIWGMAYLQPFGYPGDFKIIDMVYRNHINKDPMLSNFDKILQGTNGLIAVRNRKQYFIKILEDLSDNIEEASVLNIASGPCRDVKEYFESNPKSKISINCLDHDPNAIAYAKELLGNGYDDRVTFETANIFKYTSNKKYDLVWSAGLFDYFDDNTFKKILSNVSKFRKPNSKLIVGNFSWESETRFFKEFANWHLHYRSKEKLVELVREALGNNVKLEIHQESENVNLFAVIG